METLEAGMQIDFASSESCKQCFEASLESCTMKSIDWGTEKIDKMNYWTMDQLNK